MDANVEQKIRQLELLRNAIKWINDPTLNLSETLEIIRDKSLELVGGRAGCCCLVDTYTGKTSHFIKCNLCNQADRCGIGTAQGVIAEVAKKGKMKYIRDTATHEEYKPAFACARSKVTLPLRHGEMVLGVLNINSDKTNILT